MSIFNFKRIVSGAVLAVAALFFASGAQATIVDLINGDSGTINGALFDLVSSQSTGTGVITPFLRVQADRTEQGYNTSSSSPPFDDNRDVLTHDITFDYFMTTEVTIGDTNYINDI